MQENPRLEKLFEAVDLTKIIAEPTENKGSASDFFKPILQENNSFHEAEDEDFDEVEELEDEELEEIEEYDAERNARSLVYGMQAIETIVLLPIATYKTKKRVGGKSVIEKMRKAYTKKMNGQKLNEREELLVKSLEDYERKMMLLSDDFISTPSQTEKLIQAAIPWCQESKMKIGPGVGFWAEYAGQLIGKAAKIMLK